MKELFKVILIIACIIVLAVTLGLIEHKHDIKVWNNGKCPDCGSEWEYQDMYHVRNGGDTYIYCDKNGHSIKLSINYGK